MAKQDPHLAARCFTRPTTSDGRRAVIPCPVIRGPMAIALPRLRSPRTLPGRFGRATMLIVRRRQWGPVIGRERRRVQPVIAHPPSRPAGDPTPITLVKVRTRAKSRVLIETRELRLSTRECDFPGINIPTHYTLQS